MKLLYAYIHPHKTYLVSKHSRNFPRTATAAATAAGTTGEGEEGRRVTGERLRTTPLPPRRRRRRRRRGSGSPRANRGRTEKDPVRKKWLLSFFLRHHRCIFVCQAGLEAAAEEEAEEAEGVTGGFR